MIRKLRRLLFSAALGASVAVLGCDKNLTEVEVPDAGVALRYDLTPGQVYNGKIKWKNTITAAGGQQLITNLAFDVVLLVTGIKDKDGPLLKATPKNIKVSVSVPDGIPPEATGLSAEVAKKLNGIEIAFNANERGHTFNEPKPPEDLDMVTKATIGQLTAGVMAGLVRVPEAQLKKGETWDPKSTREGVTTTGTGTFESLVKDESGASLAKLWIDTKSESEESAAGATMKVSRAQTVAVLFPRPTPASPPRSSARAPSSSRWATSPSTSRSPGKKAKSARSKPSPPPRSKPSPTPATATTSAPKSARTAAKPKRSPTPATVTTSAPKSARTNPPPPNPSNPCTRRPPLSYTTASKRA